MIDIPPEVAKVFVGYMRAYHSQKGQHKADMIALEAMERLQPYLPKGQRLRLDEMRELFDKMREQ